MLDAVVMLSEGIHDGIPGGVFSGPESEAKSGPGIKLPEGAVVTSQVVVSFVQPEPEASTDEAGSPEQAGPGGARPEAGVDGRFGGQGSGAAGDYGMGYGEAPRGFDQAPRVPEDGDLEDLGGPGGGAGGAGEQAQFEHGEDAAETAEDTFARAQRGYTSLCRCAVGTKQQHLSGEQSECEGELFSDSGGDTGYKGNFDSTALEEGPHQEEVIDAFLAGLLVAEVEPKSPKKDMIKQTGLELLVVSPPVAAWCYPDEFDLFGEPPLYPEAEEALEKMAARGAWADCLDNEEAMEADTPWAGRIPWLSLSPPPLANSMPSVAENMLWYWGWSDSLEVTVDKAMADHELEVEGAIDMLEKAVEHRMSEAFPTTEAAEQVERKQKRNNRRGKKARTLYLKRASRQQEFSNEIRLLEVEMVEVRKRKEVQMQQFKDALAKAHTHEELMEMHPSN